MDPFDQLDVFHGDLTPTRAYVYARLPRIAEPGPWTLSGTVRGPRCLHAQTLPARARLVDLGPGPTHLARALITEPVFWTPDLPAIYDVSLKLQRGGETIATAHREIGLRAMGVRDGKLWLDGKPYVPRGVSTHSTTANLPREWHDALAMYVDDDRNPDPLAEASQWGALALVELAADVDVSRHLRELARYPAVAIVALQQQPSADFSTKTVCPNLLLAQVTDARPVPERPAWADILIVDFSDVDSLSAWSSQPEKAILLRRQLSLPLDLASARAACDALQREAAAVGQFAGYLV